MRRGNKPFNKTVLTETIPRHTHRRQTAGVVLLGLFLTFDSFTGQWQSLMFSKHRKNLAVTDMLFYSNLFSTVLSLITLVHEDEVRKALRGNYEISRLYIFSTKF